MITLYLALLLAGVGVFSLSFVAQWRIATLMRQRYPQYWKIIAEPEQGKTGAMRTWARLQHALRSPALPALNDHIITGWQRIWRYSPWIGWICWFAALSVRLLAR